LQSIANFVLKSSILYITIPFNCNCRQTLLRLLSNITFYTLLIVIGNGNNIKYYYLREIWTTLYQKDFIIHSLQLQLETKDAYVVEKHCCLSHVSYIEDIES